MPWHRVCHFKSIFSLGLTFKICCQFFNLIDLKIVSSRFAVCNLHLIQSNSTLVRPKLVWTWLHRSFNFTTAQKTLKWHHEFEFFGMSQSSNRIKLLHDIWTKIEIASIVIIGKLQQAYKNLILCALRSDAHIETRTSE